MAVVDELVTLIGYKLDERGAAILKAAKSEVVDMTKKVAALSVAVIAGKTAFQGWFGGVLENSMQMQKLSEDTNVSAEALQAWSYAVGRMGGDSKGALSNLQAFQRGLHSVIPGQFNQGLALQLPEYLQGQVKTLEQALGLLADKYSALAKQGPEGKLQAFRLGNAAGLNDDNIRMLMKGREGVRALMEDFSKLNGGIGTDKQIDENAKLWQSFYDLKTAGKGWVSHIVSEVSPTIRNVVEDVTKWIAKNDQLNKQRLAPLIETAKGVPAETKSSWANFKDDIEAVGNAEIRWFENVKSHYPHITAWIKNLGEMFKNSFAYDFDMFGKMYQGIKQDGKQILQFLSELGDSVAKIFKGGLWIFDKYLQLFGLGSNMKVPDLSHNEATPRKNPWEGLGSNAPQQVYQPPKAITVPQSTSKTFQDNRKIDIHVNGAQNPVATGKAVRHELDNIYFFNPVTAN